VRLQIINQLLHSYLTYFPLNRKYHSYIIAHSDNCQLIAGFEYFYVTVVVAACCACNNDDDAAPLLMLLLPHSHYLLLIGTFSLL